MVSRHTDQTSSCESKQIKNLRCIKEVVERRGQSEEKRPGEKK